jgi:hypothetical protein
MREDFGLGSIEGLPGGFSFGDWRNGYRRVKVPMPVGSPDGDLQTFDWDRQVQELPQLSTDKIRQRVRTLAWVLNQWVPMLGVIQIIALPVMNGARVKVIDDFHGRYGSEPSPALRPSDVWSCGWAPNSHFAAGFYQPA